MTVVYPGWPAHSLPGMAATPVTGPTPEAVARVEAMCDYMPQIALAVNGFADRNLREWAFTTMVGLLEPDVDPEAVDVIAVPQGEPSPSGTVDLHRLSEWINDKAPTAWRESVQHFEPITDAVIRFLNQGAEAWTRILLVKHALMTAGGFSAEQADGDLASLIRELAADPPPIAPEVEQLAVYLRGQAEPGETAAQVALRLIEQLRQGSPMLVQAPEVEQVAQDLRPASEQADDRGSPREPQPNSITEAVDAYRKRTGTS